MTNDAVTGTDVAGIVKNDLDMSLIGMFMSADIIVKTVIILLLAASVWSWTIIVEKWMKYKSVRFKASRFEKSFWSSEELDPFYDKVKKKRGDHPMLEIFIAAMEEWYRSRSSGRTRKDSTLRVGVKERISQIMHVARNRELENLERGLGFLATVGATAPFVGLFGTVWGIMNSFQSIAVLQDTTLAVVAPGIAEALFATAIGLFAAIPAVIAYNKLSSELTSINGRLEDFSGEFEALLSRQLDESEAV